MMDLTKIYNYYEKHTDKYPAMTLYRFRELNKRSYIAMYGRDNNIIAVLYEDGKINTNYGKFYLSP